MFGLENRFEWSRVVRQCSDERRSSGSRRVRDAAIAGDSWSAAYRSVQSASGDREEFDSKMEESQVESVEGEDSPH